MASVAQAKVTKVMGSFLDSPPIFQISLVCGVIALMSVLITAGCLSDATRRELDEREERAQRINVIYALNASDALNLLEVGHYECKEENTGDYDCRHYVKRHAADDHAELVVVDSQWSEPCPGNHEIKCQRIAATGYVRKNATSQPGTGQESAGAPTVR